ncbi:hypothetical protein ACHAWC_003341 [Mediolabrus comicus]
MHGSTSTHSSNRGLATYLYYAAIPLGTILLLVSTTYILLSSTPQSSRLDMMHNTYHQPNTHYLRTSSVNTDHFMPSSALLHGTDEFFTPIEDSSQKKDMFPSIWNDGFFSPLLPADPFFKQLYDTQTMMGIDLEFDLTQDAESVSLTTSIPDIPLEDINIEVVDGTVLHIHGEKSTLDSHVSFDKQFTLGQHLEEKGINAKLTKAGELIVSAPKVGNVKKTGVRKIPILEEL